MLASPALLTESLVYGFGAETPMNRFVGATSLVFVLGWMCSAVGLRQLRATGDSVAARVIFCAQMLGLGLAGAWAVRMLVNPGGGTGTLVTALEVAWPASVTFMLVVGVAALRARRLEGWPRYAPLGCGLVMPLGIAVGALGGRGAMHATSAVSFAVAWLLLGYAVRTAGAPKAPVVAAGAQA
jgi:hypothetical protein